MQNDEYIITIYGSKLTVVVFGNGGKVFISQDIIIILVLVINDKDTVIVLARDNAVLVALMDRLCSYSKSEQAGSKQSRKLHDKMIIDTLEQSEKHTDPCFYIFFSLARFTL